MGKTKTKLLSSSAPRKEPAAPPTAEDTKPVDTGVRTSATAEPEDAAPLSLKRSRGRPQKPRGPPPVSGQSRKFLSYDDLVARGINLSRVHLRRLSLEGNFPAAVKLGSDAIQTSVVWVAEEIEQWEQDCIKRRDAKLEARQKAGAAKRAG
jgi:predicted DNA-binding transcriptional regulator AlpA